MGKTLPTTAATLIAITLLVASCGGDESTTPGLYLEPEQDGAQEANRAPELRNVVLRPSAPRRGDALHVDARAVDPDGDPITLRYEWWVDGEQTQQTGPDLLPAELGQGQTVEVQVTAVDGRLESAAMRASVRLGNQPPMLLGIELLPRNEVHADDDITASAQATDPEGDPIEYSYTWWVNGSARGDDSEVLRAGQHRRGDEVIASVVANDGMHDSDHLRSDPIRIDNSAPKIVSMPSGFGPDGIFRYRIQVEDADDDSRFGYKLLDGPEGMVIDSLDGQMVWRPRESQAGTHLVTFEVDDRRGGKSTQSFKLELTFEETAVPAAAGTW